MPKLKSLIFDIDGTLVIFRSDNPEDPVNRFGSSHDAIGKLTLREREWYSRRDYYYERTKAEPHNTELYKEWCINQTFLLRGMKVAYVLGSLKPFPYVDGVKDFFEIVKQDKDRDYTVGILSGAMDIVAREIQKELGMDFEHSMQVRVCDGVITGTLDYIPHLSGKGKRIREIAQEQGIGLDQIAYFGDHENDISAFNAVGLPIAVCPKKEAKRDVIKATRNRVIYNFMDAIPIIQKYEKT